MVYVFNDALDSNEDKPNFIKRVGKHFKDNKWKYLAGAGIAAVGVPTTIDAVNAIRNNIAQSRRTPPAMIPLSKRIGAHIGRHKGAYITGAGIAGVGGLGAISTGIAISKHNQKLANYGRYS